MGYKTANSVWATIPIAINPSDTTFSLVSGQGSRFAFCAGTYDYTYATLIDTSVNPPTKEVVKLTYSGSGDSVSVVRARDGTSALTITTPGAGRLEVRLSAVVLNALVLNEDLQTLTDIRATSVGGTANDITTAHTKPLSDLVGVGNVPADGMVSIFIPTGSNTSSIPTYAPDGLAAKYIVSGANRPLSGNDLRPGMKAVLMFDSTIDKWILLNPATRGFEAIASVGTSTISAAGRGKVIPVTGTSTVSFVAAATLGSDFWCILQNAGTGNVTLDPNASEVMRLPDGSTYTTRTLGPGSVLVTCDGTQLHLYPFDGNSNISMYTVAGTYTHRFNPLTKKILAVAIGGGGRGGDNDGSFPNGTGGGGGSGGYAAATTTVFGASETVTVGAAGNTGTPNGGTSSLGSIVSATGGTGGSPGSGSGTGAGGAGGSPNGVVGDAGVPGNGGNGGSAIPARTWGSTAGVGSNGSVAATSGTGPGSGGGGGKGTGTYKPGADGTPGEVIVIESI